MDEQTQQKAIDATVSYLRRLGWRDVRTSGCAAAQVVGVDAKARVGVVVELRGVTELRGVRPPVRVDGFDRVDLIELTVLDARKDRAVLRHTRGAPRT
jgi:hypothetical protein